MVKISQNHILLWQRKVFLSDFFFFLNRHQLLDNRNDEKTELRINQIIYYIKLCTFMG